MRKALKSFVREITPPLLYRGIRLLARRVRLTGKLWKSPGLRLPEWYDKMYESDSRYSKHYSESDWYFLWTVVVDRIMRSGVRSVLDLGCGPGQFASLLCDKGLTQYCGVDFSARCIELAKQVCPRFEFRVADICNTDVIESCDYDCVVALEFLEHVENDIQVLDRIKSGTKLFGTVPNFSHISHVRHFSSEDEVRDRYESCFSSLQVDSFVGNAEGTIFFMIEGTRL